MTWQSKRQTTVALSTAEAETMAAVQATKEAIWIAHLLKEIQTPVTLPMRILVDNTSAIEILKNPVSHFRTKHMGIQTQFVREMVEEGIVDFQYVATTVQAADSLTKPLAPAKMVVARRLLGIVSLAELEKITT